MDYLSIFQQSDAILRLDIETYINDYIKKGGSVSKAIELLSESYKGYPHLIDIFGNLLKSTGFNALEVINEQSTKTFYNFFLNNENQINSILMKSEIPPDWVENMLKSEIWVQTLLDLSKNRPTSFFLLYCISQISQKFPEKINYLPPGCLTFKDYQNLIFPIINLKNKSNFDKFLSLSSSDVLTLYWCALYCFKSKNNSLIQRIFLSLAPEFSKYFSRTILKLYKFDDDLINISIGKTFFTQNDFEILYKKPAPSGFLSFIINQILQNTILNSPNSLDKENSIKYYLKKGDYEIQIDDLLIKELLVVYEIINNWDFVNRPARAQEFTKKLVHSIDKRFIAVFLLNKLIDKLQKNDEIFIFYLNDSTGIENLKSPECECLLEIAYHWIDLRPLIIDLIYNYLINEKKKTNYKNDYILLMTSFWLFIKCNAIKLIDSFNKMIDNFSPQFEQYNKKFFLQFISVIPPYSFDYVQLILNLINNSKFNNLFNKFPKEILFELERWFENQKYQEYPENLLINFKKTFQEIKTKIQKFK